MGEPLSLSLGGVGRLFNAVFAPPYGPLNPLHAYVLRTAEPLDFEVLTLRRAVNYCVVPFVPLAIMAFLIVAAPGDKRVDRSRPVRMALGVLGATLTTQAYFGYRFVCGCRCAACC